VGALGRTNALSAGARHARWLLQCQYGPLLAGVENAIALLIRRRTWPLDRPMLSLIAATGWERRWVAPGRR